MTGRIYTASWAVAIRHRNEIQPVRISNGTPKWYPPAKDFPVIPELCPPWSIMILDEAAFEVAYREHLDGVGVDRIASRLAQVAPCLSGDLPRALACFEADSARCHGSQFSAFWFERTNETIPEWVPKREPQMTIFDDKLATVADELAPEGPQR